MIIYHLSHIDLDGYGCQFLTHHCFEKIHAYNANYGPEVKARLEEIITTIKRETFLHPHEKRTHLILVTDLNLTTKEANWLEREAMEVGAKNSTWLTTMDPEKKTGNSLHGTKLETTNPEQNDYDGQQEQPILTPRRVLPRIVPKANYCHWTIWAQ